MSRLTGKTAVITGGNSGIGRETAKAFVAEGANVVVFGRNQKTLDETVAELGGKGIGVQGDVTSAEDLSRLFATAKETFGGVDVLFANAGIAHPRPLEQVDRDFFDQTMDINVKGAYFTVQAALPLLGEGASVILTSSTVDTLGFPGLSVYAASKAAMRSLVRSFAAELAPRGIRVNSIAPGPIETPIYERMGMGEEATNEMGSAILGRVPAGRFGKSNEIAAPVVFLASDESSYMFGAELTVDGGMGQV